MNLPSRCLLLSLLLASLIPARSDRSEEDSYEDDNDKLMRESHAIAGGENSYESYHSPSHQATGSYQEPNNYQPSYQDFKYEPQNPSSRYQSEYQPQNNQPSVMTAATKDYRIEADGDEEGDRHASYQQMQHTSKTDSNYQSYQQHEFVPKQHTDMQESYHPSTNTMSNPESQALQTYQPINEYSHDYSSESNTPGQQTQHRMISSNSPSQQYMSSMPQHRVTPGSYQYMSTPAPQQGTASQPWQNMEMSNHQYMTPSAQQNMGSRPQQYMKPSGQHSMASTHHAYQKPRHTSNMSYQPYMNQHMIQPSSQYLNQQATQYMNPSSQYVPKTNSSS